MRLKKGDRIRHPNKSDWGLGQVLEDSKGHTVRVFFVGAGEKTLALDYVAPEKVPRDDAGHPVLDNLQMSESGEAVKYQSLDESKAYFLQRFPEGFRDKAFLEMERDYKVSTHELAIELLSKEKFDRLLKAGDFNELSKRLQRVMNASNLVFRNEKMAFKDGMARTDRVEQFALALNESLWGTGDLEPAFTKMAKALEEMEADKWTNASYFLFILKPDTYMFVKPTITQYAAELSRFEINYKPQLNWLTYKSVLDFSNYLLSELADLEPRDMIDVQSFMWCVGPRA